MLYLARWQTMLILAVVVLGFVFVVPNFFSRETVESWPTWMPRNQIVLGLDLQGGAYLLYEVDRTDYIQKRLRAQTSDIRRALLEDPRIGYTGLGPRENGVQFRVRDLNDLDHFAYALLGEWLWEIGNNWSGTLGIGQIKRQVDMGETQAARLDTAKTTTAEATAAYLVTPGFRLRGGLLGRFDERSTTDQTDTTSRTATAAAESETSNRCHWTCRQNS